VIFSLVTIHPFMNYPKLHNAMWPGLVGKGGDEPEAEPAISLDRMLELTAGADVDGQKFDGIDYFLFHPHTDPDASDDELKAIADKIANHGFTVGSLVAPVWPGTVGDSAMGTDEQQQKFLTAVEKACRIAKIFNEHGLRKYGVIRIDSAEFGVEKWREDPEANTKRIAETFKKAAQIAADNGERLAAEGEICWAGMHSWKDMLNLLEEVGMPESLGFQCDLAHTYLYLMGYNAPEHALLQDGYSEEEFFAAYKTMTDALRPWTIDSMWLRTTAPSMELDRMTKLASTARQTTPMAKSTSSNAPATGSREPRTEASSTFAGMDACSRTRC